MYYLKEKTFKYLCISWGRDDDTPYYFRVYKSDTSPFFSRYSKVIEITFYGRRLILEF